MAESNKKSKKKKKKKKKKGLGNGFAPVKQIDNARTINRRSSTLFAC
jgi:ribosome assembly protein YihI (activator of Der GTPase)